MLRKNEKQTLKRLFLLGVGAPIGLDGFYEGDITGGFLAVLSFLRAGGFVGMDLSFYFKNFSFAKRI
tara:strand:- start:421 stop:621 length:201 start_codon:yes stop_codon:yes gene_type:complete